MKRNLLITAIAVFTASFCLCLAGNQSAPSFSTLAAAETQTENVEQTIRRLETERSQAIARGDFATLERIYADDFSLVSTSGTVRNKAQFIADHKSGALKTESQTFADVKVRVYGDAAIVTGLMTQKGRDKGQDISGQIRYTRVYVKRNGQWQFVAGHNSRSGKP